MVIHWRSALCIVFLFVLCSFLAPIKWVAIGDSITYLNEHPDETGNRITKGYMKLVCEKRPDIEYVNKGYNGWTSGDIASKIETLGLEKADIYSVFLGTNDWWQGRPIGSLKDYESNTGSATLYGAFRIIIDKLRLLNPNAQIILITPLQRGDFISMGNMKNNAYGSYKSKNDQSLEQFATALVQLAKKENFATVDLYHNSGITQKNMVKFKRLKDPSTGSYKNYPYPDYTKIPFDPSVDEYPYPTDAIDMTYDGLHPSDKGYEVITSMILKVLRK
ncbi:MAG TPA: SGNH/GDSL hydrolase family protein [Chryseolinea sp.]|nr:SGNH/GDSL hydrolase family protein [Chryseolinea sp.]